MKRFTQFTLALIFGFSLIATGWAQDQTQNQVQKRAKAQIHLQDQSQSAVQSLNKFQYRYQFQDLNGDGVNDFLQNGKMQRGNGEKGGYGPDDGTGNQGIGPQDGTGFGAGNGTGAGDCDGTGPKGAMKKGAIK